MINGNSGKYSVLRNKIIKYLSVRLDSKLLAHCRGTEAAAVQIAAAIGRFDLISACSTAGLLHDAAKYLTLDKMVFILKRAGGRAPVRFIHNAGFLHGFVSAVIARDVFKITDCRVIEAIRHHTLGRSKMNTIEKIIFISDYIEPNRKFDGMDALRRRVYSELFNEKPRRLDRALLTVVRDKMRTLENLGFKIEKTLPVIEKKLTEDIKIYEC